MDEILRIMLPSRNQNFSCLVMRIDIEGSEAVRTFCKYSRDNVLLFKVRSTPSPRHVAGISFHGQKLLSAGLDSADNENDRTDHCYGSTDEDVFTE